MNRVEPKLCDVQDDAWVLRPDPLGSRMLFFVQRTDVIFLSTSIRDLVPLLEEVRLSRIPALEYLLTGSVVSSIECESLIEGIGAIPPGWEMKVSDSSCELSRFALPFIIERGLDEARLVDRIRVEITAAVRSSVRGHDRVACLLSGGLDSCLLAATSIRLEQELGHQTLLFNVGGGLGTHDEQYLRSLFCRIFERPLITVDPDPNRGLVAAISRLNEHADYPLGCTFSGIFEDLGKRIQAHGCSLLLSGDGGDELFDSGAHLGIDLPVGSWGFWEALAWRRMKRSEGFAAAAFNLIFAKSQLRGFGLSDALSRALPLSLRCSSFSELELGDSAELIGSLAKDQDLFSYRWIRHLAAIAGSGFALSDYWRFRSAQLVPTYEPRFDTYMSDPLSGLSTACPMNSTVLLALACSQPLDRRLALHRSGLGKDLLRFAALDRLPREIAFYKKIGATDDSILNRAATREIGAIRDLLSSRVLKRSGIAPADAALQPDWLLTHKAANWFRLLVLSSWSEAVSTERGCASPRAWETFEPISAWAVSDE